MGDARPIGIFDSGVGGLSVLRHLRLLLPAEDVLYVADAAWCPYGSKPAGIIRERIAEVVGVLQARGVKLVVVACNSASTVGLADVRRRYPQLTFVGMEPAVKPAVEQTRTRAIGVLATATTAAGESLARLVSRFGRWAGAAAEDADAPAGRDNCRGVAVHVAVPEGLVELVERGAGDSPAAEALLRPIMTRWREAGVDVVVLGCTHYPFARAAVERLAGPGVVIVDPAPAVARQAARVLAAGGALTPSLRAGQTTFLATGEADAFYAIVSRLAL